MFSSTHSSLCRREAEQTVPVSCEASTNTTLTSAASETAEAVFQTGCLEMVARLLGDNVVAVILACLSVVVIQVRYDNTKLIFNDSQDTWSRSFLLSGEVSSSTALGLLSKTKSLFIYLFTCRYHKE